jgi:CHAT domain-containing protein
VLSASPVAHADADDAVRAEVDEALREGRLDVAITTLEAASERANRSGQPVRIGRLELLRSEIEAAAPTRKGVESARSAVLHLGEAPEAALASVRYHIGGAAVTLAEGRLGACALHVQLGRAALAPLLPSAKGAAPAVKPRVDPRTDELKLGQTERALIAGLRQRLEQRGGVTDDFEPGTLAALAAYAAGRPLLGQPGSDEPQAVKGPRPSGTALLGKLDKALEAAQQRDISAAEARGEERQAAVARSRHAETLLRLGKVKEAEKVRRQALDWYRAHGTIDEVLAEGRHLAEAAERQDSPRARLAARREIVDDLERYLATLAGPARAAAHAKYRADYVALVEATAVAASPGHKEPKGAKPLTVEPLEAVALMRDRSVWDEATLLSDGARWKRLGAAAAADLRRALDGVARRVHDETLMIEDAQAPATRARQQVADALARAAPVDKRVPSAAERAAASVLGGLDLAGLRARLKSRSLVLYGRIDPQRIAIATLAPKGPAQLAIVPFAAADETSWAADLRTALHDREGGDGWREPARKLYQAVVWPIEPVLVAGGTVFVPDGALGVVPFAALEDDSGKPLGDRVALSFLPSLAALAKEPAATTAKEQDQSALLLAIARSTEPGLAAPPGVDRESAAIAQTLTTEGWKPKPLSPTTSAAQFAASPVAGAAGFGVVQLTTRARLDGEAPLLGYIVLAASRLFAFDLGAATWRTNLLVLDGFGSAEQPPLAAARGIAGVVSGALLGPAGEVLVSDWPADGPSSAALLCRFYERYAGGEPAAAALAGAQRDMEAAFLEQPLLHQAGADPIADAARFKHPRYWAPFTIWGVP